MKHSKLLLILFGLWCFCTGLIDLDWMLIAPRFNAWYFTVDYWEFNPFLRLNWWLAYAVTILRIVAGALLLGWVLSKTLSQT